MLVMARMVKCVKLGRELPGLEEAPFPSELGKRIFNEVSQQAWEMWPPHQMILINHFGLSLNDPQARQFLRDQMEEFFFGADAAMPEGWVPEGAPGQAGKGAPGPSAKGGAPRSK
jgi:Fe-S cluster biosynthesis and repair protein YggX